MKTMFMNTNYNSAHVFIKRSLSPFSLKEKERKKCLVAYMCKSQLAPKIHIRFDFNYV
jgi:hypothetical protein